MLFLTVGGEESDVLSAGGHFSSGHNGFGGVIILVEGDGIGHEDAHGLNQRAEGGSTFDGMVSGSKFGISGMSGDGGSFLRLRSDGDAEHREDVAHGGFEVAKVMGHAGVCMDSKVIGVCERVLFVSGELEHDCVGGGELVAGIKKRDVRLESEVADDSFDSLEGNRVGGGVVTRETGEGIHDVDAGTVAEVKDGADKTTIGSFEGDLELSEFLWGGRNGSCE